MDNKVTDTATTNRVVTAVDTPKNKETTPPVVTTKDTDRAPRPPRRALRSRHLLATTRVVRRPRVTARRLATARAVTSSSRYARTGTVAERAAKLAN